MFLDFIYGDLLKKANVDLTKYDIYFRRVLVEKDQDRSRSVSNHALLYKYQNKEFAMSNTNIE